MARRLVGIDLGIASSHTVRVLGSATLGFAAADAGHLAAFGPSCSAVSRDARDPDRVG